MEALTSEIKRLASTADEAGRVKLLSALQDLTLSIETPFDTFLRIGFGAVPIAIVKVGLDMGIYDMLVKATDEMTTDQLAQKTGADISLTGKGFQLTLHPRSNEFANSRRILRYLASIGTIKETGQDRYAASKATKVLSNPSYAAGVHHYFDTAGPAWQALPSFLAESGYKNITEHDKAPFQKGHRTDLSLFQWFPANPQNFAWFSQYMTVQRGEMPDWLSVFPVEAECTDLSSSSSADRAIFVDVGGSVGHQCAAFKSKFQRLPGRVILQDLPGALEHALPTQGVEKMVHNFFEPQTVQGAKFYYLRNVLHDWTDDKCCAILKNIAGAMAKDSLVLIDEMVLPNVGVSDRAATLDLTMMVAAGAIERTLGEWQALLDMAGFKIERIETYTVSLNDSIIVATPK